VTRRPPRPGPRPGRRRRRWLRALKVARAPGLGPTGQGGHTPGRIIACRAGRSLARRGPPAAPPVQRSSAPSGTLGLTLRTPAARSVD
jgi:hypothetical protein